MESKPSVNSVFGAGERKVEERVEPVKREEPKKPAAEPVKKPIQEQPQKVEPVKSFEQAKVEPERKPVEPTKKFGFGEVAKEKAANEIKKPAEKKVENGKKPEQAKPSAEAAKPEVKAPKPKAPATKKRPLEPSEIRHSARERKPVHVENIAATAVHHAPLSVPSGHGTKLADIPHIHHELGKRKSSDAAVQQLHRLVYGRVGEAGKRKEFLRKFNGFADEKSVITYSYHFPFIIMIPCVD